MKKFYLVFFCLAFLAGCETISNARKAQEKHKEVGDRNYVAKFSETTITNANLETLINFALTNRPAMTSARLAVEDARLELKQIEAEAPLASKTPWGAFDLNASAGYGESSQPAHISNFKGKTRASDPSGTLSLNILIYDFGRNAARAKAHVENVIAAEWELEEAGCATCIDVTRKYINCLVNDALLAVAKTNVAMHSEHLAVADEKYKQGVAQKLDLLRARLELATSKEREVTASNDVVVAKANLRASLGLFNIANVDIIEKVEDPLGKMVSNFTVTTDSVEKLFDYAQTNAPPLLIMRARLRAAQANVDAAIADLMPNVSANLALNWTDPLWYWHWGVDVVQSLFTGFRRTTAVDRAVVALEATSAMLENTQHSILEELEVAVAKRESAKESLVAAEASLKEALENYDTIKEKFAVGEASRVDFTDAVSALTTSYCNRIQAFYRGQLAEAEILSIIE